jgi:hypothetical protein
MSVICYMPVVCLVIGGELGLGYMLFIANLCNHILLQSGGGPGAQLCTLLEEWVREPVPWSIPGAALPHRA